MGQKTNPITFRSKYRSYWNIEDSNAKSIHEDKLIRELIEDFLDNFIVGTIEIGRDRSLKIRVQILQKIINRKKRRISGNILINRLKKLTNFKEVHLLFVHHSGIRRSYLRRTQIRFCSSFPIQLDGLLIAKLVGDMIKDGRSINQVEREIKRIYKICHIEGIRVQISGRFFGNAMAKRRSFQKGVVSLQSIRAALDYGATTIPTVHGLFGIKVWINNYEYTKKN